ncbi:MAG: hypothetical protein AAF988_01035 [Pseudomonadota bacterium]
MSKRIRVSDKLKQEWARATYSLLVSSRKNEILSPQRVYALINILFEHKIVPRKAASILDDNSFFDEYWIAQVASELKGTSSALAGHASKTSHAFQCMFDSYLAALENKGNFIISRDFSDLTFEKVNEKAKKSTRSSQKLPQAVLDEWREATMGQMEASGVLIDQEYRSALAQNLLSIADEFGHLTRKQFDDEANESNILNFLDSITDEPHAEVATYMKMAAF